MAIRTYDQLERALGADYRSRKDELDVIREQLNSVPVTSVACHALVRAGVALLYAHWEGFIKWAAQAYLEYVAWSVASQRVSHRQLSAPYLGLAITQALNLQPDTKPWLQHAQVVSFLRDYAQECAILRTTHVIGAGANLNYARLVAILETLGLDPTPYELQQHLIDTRLLGARNNIAHGDFFYVEARDYRELQDRVTDMMCLFRNQLQNAAALQVHLLRPAPPVIAPVAPA